MIQVSQTNQANQMIQVNRKNQVNQISQVNQVHRHMIMIVMMMTAALQVVQAPARQLQSLPLRREKMRRMYWEQEQELAVSV